MVSVILNNFTVQDCEDIEQLRELGYSDEEIQKIYDRTIKRRIASGELDENGGTMRV